MCWIKLVPVLTIFTFLFLTACSEESDLIITPQNDISNENKIIGTWLLTEIQYPSNGNTIKVLPGDFGISMTLKFFENKMGQMIRIEKGSTRVDVFTWNVLGPVVEVVDEDGDWETLRCEFIDGDLCIEHGFETLDGELVIATFVFEKKQD
jgi:hypothetical protein